MAFKIGSTTQANIPVSTSNDRGSYVVSDGAGGAFWAYPGTSASSANVNNSEWLYRTVYTHGYLAAGYKGYNPWRTVNKTWHATEVTIYCGEQIAYTQGYTNGVWSDYFAYICAGGGFQVSSTIVCSYSLSNGTIRMFTGDGFGSQTAPYGYVGNDPKNEGITYGTAGFASGGVGGMAMSASKMDPVASQNIVGQVGYITGGGDTSTQKLHFPTEVMYTTTASPNTGYGDASYGQTTMWINQSSSYYTMAFSNDTYSTGGWGGWAKDYQCKMLGSKQGWFYMGNGNNVTTGISKINQSTGATISNFSKVRAYGEENWEDGQDNGYCMGHYDGQQNNHTIRQSYSSDTQVTLGAAAMPKGHYGQSSGACSTAAATVVATLVQ